MAEKETTKTCGKRRITYPASASFTCACQKFGKCTYIVILKDGTVFVGTDLVAPPKPKPPHVTVAGGLKEIALALQRIWKRRIIVPTGEGGRKLSTRTLRGTPAEIASALGLVLTTKRL